MNHEQKTFEDYCKRNDISIIKRTDGKYHMRTTRAVYAMWQEAYKLAYDKSREDKIAEDYWWQRNGNR